MNLIPLEPPNFDGEEGKEILRVWLGNEPESEYNKFALLPRISNDPVAWGGILVDIARHVAKAYADANPQNDKVYSTILNRIKHGFDAEWEFPTDEITNFGEQK